MNFSVNSLQTLYREALASIPQFDWGSSYMDVANAYSLQEQTRPVKRTLRRPFLFLRIKDTGS